MKKRSNNSNNRYGSVSTGDNLLEHVHTEEITDEFNARLDTEETHFDFRKTRLKTYRASFVFQGFIGATLCNLIKFKKIKKSAMQMYDEGEDGVTELYLN